MKRKLLIPSLVALAASACVEPTTAGDPAETRQAAISTTTGDISTTLLWNESIVQGSDAGIFSVKVNGSPGTFQAVPQPSGTHLAADLLPGSYAVSAHAFGCLTDSLALNTFPVTANATTAVQLGIDLTTGRATWSLELNGVVVPADANVIVHKRCTMSPCAVGICEFFTSYSTTLGALMGKLLPSGPMDVEVESDGERGAFTLNVPAAATTNLGTIHAQSGRIDGRVILSGAPIFDAARSVTVSGQSGRTSWSAQPSTSGGVFSSGVVPPGDYRISVSGVSCANAEGSDTLGSTNVHLDDGVILLPNVDITNNAGQVNGAFSKPLSGTVRLTLNDGDCGSIETNADGRLAAFMPPGHYDADVFSVRDAALIDRISFDVTAGETTDLGDHSYTPSASDVTGTVFLNGLPASAAGLSMGGDLSGDVSSGDGTYRTTGVAPGSHVGQVLLCGQTVAQQPFTTFGGPDTILDFDIMSAAGFIAGTITVDGSPAANASFAGPGNCTFQTDASGRFQVLLPGSSFTFTTLVTSTGGSAVSNQVITVFGGDTIDIGTVSFTSSVTALAPLGAACTNGAQCASTFCADAVCCSEQCGGACQACGADGTCTAIPSCAPAPTCSGSTCPLVTLAGPGPSFDHLTIKFGPALGTGEVSARPCDAMAPPAGYRIMQDATNNLACADIEVSSTLTYNGTIEVCVYYPDALLDDGMGGTVSENNLNLSHFVGGDWVMVTTVRDPSTNRVCGQVTSLSPFALVAPLVDVTPPVIAGVPSSPLVAYATSTAGAKVTYTLPTAVDAVDGPVAVTCDWMPGATFPIGKTTVSCHATDAHGNTSPASFTVWVQVQAPADGTFFLKPIRSDGNSIFKIGRAVPVKFQLLGASAGIKNLVARLEVTRLSGNVSGNNDCDGDEDGEDIDMVFKYRSAKGIYGYRWKTSNQTQGTYELRADLGDSVSHKIVISLKRAK
jgi:hypothetical protein